MIFCCCFNKILTKCIFVYIVDTFLLSIEILHNLKSQESFQIAQNSLFFVVFDVAIIKKGTKAQPYTNIININELSAHQEARFETWDRCHGILVSYTDDNDIQDSKKKSGYNKFDHDFSVKKGFTVSIVPNVTRKYLK